MPELSGIYTHNTRTGDPSRKLPPECRYWCRCAASGWKPNANHVQMSPWMSHLMQGTAVCRHCGRRQAQVVAFDLSVMHVAYLGTLRRISFNLISFSSHLIMTSILIILGHFLIMHDSVSCSWEIPNYVLSCGTH